MRCRVEGCKNISRGPRFGYICDKHRSELSAKEQIDRQLVATRDDIKNLVYGRPSRLDDGWRSTLAGNSLRRLLGGEAVVRLVDGGRRLRLEE